MITEGNSVILIMGIQSIQSTISKHLNLLLKSLIVIIMAMKRQVGPVTVNLSDFNVKGTKMYKFHEKMRQMDEQILQDAIKNGRLG